MVRTMGIFTLKFMTIIGSNIMTLYHATTPKKAKKYRETGAILSPVCGFTTDSDA